MPSQMRMSADDRRWYDVNRDVVHHFKWLAARVSDRMHERDWPELFTLLDARGVTIHDLGAAHGAFMRFVIDVLKHPDDTVEDALVRSGWGAAKLEARIAVMALIGLQSTGMYFHGVRAATLDGERADDVRELVDRADKVAWLLKLPKWRRLLLLLRQRWRGRTWHADPIPNFPEESEASEEEGCK